MSRIFRYVFREILGPTLLGLAIYTFVLLMNAIFNVAELAIKKDLPILTILKILGLFLPQFLSLTLPMSVLLGVLIGVGRLSADSEIIALRSCGVSYRTILIPILTLGVLGWMIGTVLALWVEPRTSYTRHRIVNRLLLRSDLRKELKPRVFFEEFQGMLLYADRITRGGSDLGGVFIYQSDPEGRDLITTARRGHLDYDPKTGNIRLLLEGGLTHRSDPSDAMDYQIYGAERQMVLKEADAGYKLRLRLLKEPQQKNYREMNLRELSEAWETAATTISHEPTRRRVQSSIEVFYQERFVIPLASVVFSLIGLPLGVYNRRGGKSSGIALSLGVVLVYWLLLTTGENLASEARVDPRVALWFGNVFFTLLAVFLIVRRERREAGAWTSAEMPRFSAWRTTLRRYFRRARRGRRASSSGPAESPDPELRAEPPLPLGRRLRSRGGPAFSTLLDRYVLRSYLKFLFLSMLSIYVIFLVVDFRELIDDIINSRVSGHLLLSFFKYRTPWVANQILPVSCLVSTLLCFGLLARFNEVTAMKAGGLSLYRISVPVLVTTLLISLLSLYVEGKVIPYSNQRANQIRDQIRGRSARSYSQPQRRWILGQDGLFYNYRNYARAAPQFLPLGGGGTFQGFTVYRLDANSFNIRERVYAREATWKNDQWSLLDGWERNFGPGGSVVSFERFEEKPYSFQEEPSRFVGEVRTPDQMSYWQLKDFIADLKTRGYSVQELTVGLYEKLALPFVSLVMVVLGLPFAFRTGRRGSLYGIGLSIGLVVVYYSTFAVMSALGEIGFLPPFLAAWAPNILFTGTGAYLMLSLVRT